MSELAEWLLTQVGADEEVARRGYSNGGEVPIHCEDCPCMEAEPGPYPCECKGPARVLAECAAKRELIDLHEARQVGFGPDVIGCATCDAVLPETWGPDLLDPGGSLYPCPTLRLLAAPFADRPGYRQEWAPE